MRLQQLIWHLQRHAEQWCHQHQASRCTGSQPAGDLSHPPGGRLPLLYGRPAVTFPAEEHQRPWLVPSYTAWWQRHIGVNNLPKVVTQLFSPRVAWRFGVVVTSLVSINGVNLRWTQLVLGWVTVSGFDSWKQHFILVCNQPPRSTQPSTLCWTPKGVDALRLGR